MARPKPQGRKPGVSRGTHYDKGGKTRKNS